MVSWRVYVDVNEDEDMAFAKATKAQQVALRDALVKAELAVQKAAIGSGAAKDLGAAIDALITALEAAIAPVKAAT